MGRQKEDSLFNRIEAARTAQGLSRQALADEVGVHYQTIGYLGRGEYSPSLTLAWCLADRRPSRLRDQGPRRVLVLTPALVMAALVFTIFISKGRVNLVHPRLAAQKLVLRL